MVFHWASALPNAPCSVERLIPVIRDNSPQLSPRVATTDFRASLTVGHSKMVIGRVRSGWQVLYV